MPIEFFKHISKGYFELPSREKAEQKEKVAYFDIAASVKKKKSPNPGIRAVIAAIFKKDPRDSYIKEQLKLISKELKEADASFQKTVKGIKKGHATQVQLQTLLKIRRTWFQSKERLGILTREMSPKENEQIRSEFKSMVNSLSRNYQSLDRNLKKMDEVKGWVGGDFNALKIRLEKGQISKLSAYNQIIILGSLAHQEGEEDIVREAQIMIEKMDKELFSNKGDAQQYRIQLFVKAVTSKFPSYPMFGKDEIPLIKKMVEDKEVQQSCKKLLELLQKPDIDEEEKFKALHNFYARLSEKAAHYNKDKPVEREKNMHVLMVLMAKDNEAWAEVIHPLLERNRILVEGSAKDQAFLAHGVMESILASFDQALLSLPNALL